MSIPGPAPAPTYPISIYRGTVIPSTVQVPGNVVTEGNDISLGNGIWKRGRLYHPITVRRNHRPNTVFPAGSIVEVKRFPPADRKVVVKTNAAGNPRLVGGRQTKHRRRVNRKARNTRRR